jgi:hypothetical protein
MGGATREYYVNVLKEALQIIEAAEADHLVIGSAASRVLLGMPLSEAEDVEVLIGTDDADRLLEVLSQAGYATHRRDDGWIYKAAKPDVTIDLIFRAGERIRLDAEHLSRSTVREREGIALHLPSPKDLVIMKATFDAQDRQGRWYDALSILRRFEIDWEYLARRGLDQAPRRVLSLLLYAMDDGIHGPDDAVSMLGGRR